jgi:hypothetical protein
MSAVTPPSSNPLRKFPGLHVLRGSKDQFTNNTAIMLLNPTHKVTFSGLPPDLLDTYVRYKKGTRAIVKWLSEHAPTETRKAYLGAKTLPINDLVKLARVASKHVLCMPEIVHFYFRETIEARSSLSKYFRKQTCRNLMDSSTVNHEHFTAR